MSLTRKLNTLREENVNNPLRVTLPPGRYAVTTTLPRRYLVDLASCWDQYGFVLAELPGNRFYDSSIVASWAATTDDRVFPVFFHRGRPPLYGVLAGPAPLARETVRYTRRHLYIADVNLLDAKIMALHWTVPFRLTRKTEIEVRDGCAMDVDDRGRKGRVLRVGGSWKDLVERRMRPPVHKAVAVQAVVPVAPVAAVAPAVGQNVAVPVPVAADAAGSCDAAAAAALVSASDVPAEAAAAGCVDDGDGRVID